MVSGILRSEIMNIVDNFNQSEFNQENSYYFVRFSNDFVYIDRCSNGRIELFSRLTITESSNLLIEVLNIASNKYKEFIKNKSFSDSLDKPLKRVMHFGLLDM